MQEKIKPLIVQNSCDGMKISKFLFRCFPAMTKQIFFKICRSGELRINSKRVKGTETLSEGDIVRIPPILQTFLNSPNKKNDGSLFSDEDLQKLKKSILYEDEDVVVFNKPAGLATQGGTKIKKSLDKMASALFSNNTVSLVHRLDKETSGLILCAKNIKSAQVLAKSFVEKTTQKQYLALVVGDIKKATGKIQTLMVKGKVFTDQKSADKYEKETGESAKIAITEFEVLNKIPNLLSFVLFKPITGRTHQLRLHSAHILQTPILGDSLYGSKIIPNKLKNLTKSNKLFLLSYKLKFQHPRSGKLVTITCPIPEFMNNVLSYLEFGDNNL